MSNAPNHKQAHDAVADYITAVLVRTIKTDDYFTDLEAECLPDEIGGMVWEQIEVLNEELAERIVEQVLQQVG